MAASSTTVEDKVAAWVARHDLLGPGDRVAVAVSGGSDSVALLLLLHGFAPAWGLQLVVAHFDHRWRPDAEREAVFVAELAESLGWPFRLGRAEAAAPASNREAAGRRARYAFLHALLAAGACNRAATGHTADDQAETVLLRVLRGAGNAGLAGIMPRRDGGAIVRPLLAVPRRELRAWLQARGQTWCEDPSNLQLDPRRNLLRQRFLPELTTAFNPSLTERLGTLAEVARAEEAFWAEYLAPLMEQMFQPAGQGWRAQRAALHGLPVAVRRRLLREAVRRAQGGLQGVDFRDIEVLVGWLGDSRRHPRRYRLGRVECRVTARHLEVGVLSGL